MQVRPPMINFKMTVNWLYCFCMFAPTPTAYKSSCPLTVIGEKSAFGQASALPDTFMAASKIKQTFPSTNSASLLASEQQAAGPHF